MLIRLKLAALAGIFAAACSGSFDPDAPSGGGDGGVDEAAVRADFDTNVSPILATRCNACHDTGSAGAPAFGKTYETYVAYSSAAGKLVDCTTAKSTLYSKGAHLGPAFDATEAPKVEAFIALHAMVDPACGGGGGAKAATGSLAFAAGANTVDLSTLGPGLEGAQLTFNAEAVGGGVYLSQITLVAGANGLKVTHPLFETCPNATKTVDPTDKFATLDQTVNAGQTAALGVGSLSILGAALGDKYGLSFDTLTPAAGSQGAPVDNGGACAQ